ncbi:MAG: hypothetical protein IKR21_01260 [Oscillospiraceae bacterium]|nr:hypothetical protein [Oscillospiraceae bacterium]
MRAEIISGLALIAVAVIEALATIERRGIKKSRARTERREAERARENHLAMRMMDANLDLSIATATAVEEGKHDGELKCAREKAKKTQEEYQNFVLEVAARQVAKV